jgi:hypothetical protein
MMASTVLRAHEEDCRRRVLELERQRATYANVERGFGPSRGVN